MIVPLRPLTAQSNILPEQTLGRGPRWVAFRPFAVDWQHTNRAQWTCEPLSQESTHSFRENAFEGARDHTNDAQNSKQNAILERLISLMLIAKSRK